MGAVESAISESEHLAIGEDRTLRWLCTDSAGSAQSMTGWTLSLNIMDKQGGTALITKTPTVENGNGTDDRAVATIDAADWSVISKAGAFFYTLHRTDSGSVTLLAFGTAVVHNALATA